MGLNDQPSCNEIRDRALIERYVAGNLADDEVEALESHYLTCARCQAELRLAMAIRDTLPEVRGASQAGDTFTLSLRRRRRGRPVKVGAAAIAVAAVLAGLLFVRPTAEPDRPELREEVPDVPSAPSLLAPEGEVASVEEFRWEPVTSADRYRVTVYNAESAVVWQIETRETHAGPPDANLLEPDVQYLWEVAARVGFDRWISSSLTRFRISSPN